MANAGIVRLLPLVLLVAAGHAPALDPDKPVTQYVIDQWGTQDGLPHNVVRAVTQGSDGYLWLATQSGAARFDGMNFTVFDKSNTASLASEDIRDVFQQSNGDMWLATYGGGVLRMHDGRHTRYTAKDGLGDDIVRCIFEDSDGDLWFCTASGLTRLHDGTFTTYTTEDGLLNNLVYDAHEDRNGDLWIGVLGGVSRFSEGHFSNFRAGEELPESLSFVHGFVPDPDGGIWMGSYGAGLLRFQNGQFDRLSRTDGLADDRISNIAMDSDSNLWISTYDKGVQRYREGRFESLTTEDGLHSNLPFDVFEDDQQNIWIGTAGGGLHRLTTGPFRTFGPAEGLPDPKVFAVLGEPDGPIWIGTEGTGLHRFENGEFRTYTSEDGLNNNNVISLAHAENGGLWIGTFGGGLNLLEDGELRAWTGADGLAGEQIFTMEPDSGNSLWIGTINGLVRMENGSFTTYTTSDGLSKNDVRALLKDREGTLWIGTNGGGLNRFDGDTFRVYQRDDGLESNLVYSLFEDSRGVLWIGTKGGGLSRLEDGRITTFGTEQGLWHESIFAIAEDHVGNLWLSCPRGIFRVARSSFEAIIRGESERLDITTFDRSDGLRSGHTVGGSQPAVWRGSDYRLWFATFDGLASVHPDRIRRSDSSPPVLLEKLVVDGRPVLEPEGKVLPPGSRNLQIHYTAIELTHPEDVRFRYRLEGLDSNWTEAGNRRVAYYSHIPPGEYRFQVQAATGDGPWTDRTPQLQFTLEPRFYQTTWFLALMGLALIGLGASLYALRARSLRASERRLSLLVGARTRELAEAKERFERLSKTDVLTGLPNRRNFEERLQGEWDRALRSGHQLASVMVDIDNFKRFNDTHGHRAGDECLMQVGRTIEKALIRGGDLVARYGGDEFVVLLPETDAEGTEIVAKRIRSIVAELDIRWPGAQAPSSVTVSAGAAVTRPRHHGQTPKDFLNDADRALYRAKIKGRNRVEIETAGNQAGPG